jgi:hypothetical protein
MICAEAISRLVLEVVRVFEVWRLVRAPEPSKLPCSPGDDFVSGCPEMLFTGADRLIRVIAHVNRAQHTHEYIWIWPTVFGGE